MGETSAIEWTDATVNFWWGCTKVGPGCDHCYAESFDKRTGGAHWGTGAPRRQIASAAATLAKLNRQGGKRVFIQSMSDLFDNEVPDAWFAEAWRNLCEADACRIQIVTKRISAVEKRLSVVGQSSWWRHVPWPEHAGLMITVVNQAEADRDISRLLALKAKLGIPWVGLSMEPLLGPVDLLRWSGLNDDNDFGIDWVIVGGESGPKARPMHPDWARSLRDQCQAAGVPFFFKQWGEWKPLLADDGDWPTHKPGFRRLTAAGLSACDGWPIQKVGKAHAGRLLDGREWNDMPGVLTNA